MTLMTQSLVGAVRRAVVTAVISIMSGCCWRGSHCGDRGGGGSDAVEAYDVVGGGSLVLGDAATGVCNVCVIATARSSVPGIHLCMVVAGEGATLVDVRIVAALAAWVVVGDGVLMAVPLVGATGEDWPAEAAAVGGAVAYRWVVLAMSTCEFIGEARRCGGCALLRALAALWAATCGARCVCHCCSFCGVLVCVS